MSTDTCYGPEDAIQLLYDDYHGHHPSTPEGYEGILALAYGHWTRYVSDHHKGESVENARLIYSQQLIKSTTNWGVR